MTRTEKARETAVDFDGTLFDLLRQKRKELSEAADVPPYVVFSDRTLVEMAAYFPQESSSLLRINGVGEVKAERYGETFLAVIREYCIQNNISENLPSAEAERRSSLGLDGRYLVYGQAYNAGESIEALMRRFQVKLGTIIDNLAKYLADGNRLQSGDELRAHVSAPVEVQQIVFETFDELGIERLKPVFDKLEGRASYDDLKILRILYVNREQ